MGYEELNHQEKVQVVIDLMQDWFLAVENGAASKRLPDPSLPRYDRAYVDNIIKIIDDFVNDELTDHPSYWENQGLSSKGKSIDMPMDMDRLTGASREAFVQAIKDKIREVFDE